MEEFYQYIYANLMVFIIVSIGISFAGTAVYRKGLLRLGRRLMIAAIVADIFLALIYFTSYIAVQYVNDLLFTLLWGGIAYWNFLRYKRR